MAKDLNLIVLEDDEAESIGLSDRVPPGKCGWVEFPDEPCHKPAVYHVVWDPDSATPVCTEHKERVLDEGYTAIHRYEGACWAPEGEFDPENNRCVMPD